MLVPGSTPHERPQNYLELAMQVVDPEETDATSRRLQHQHIYSPDRFRRTIEAQLGRMSVQEDRPAEKAADRNLRLPRKSTLTLV